MKDLPHHIKKLNQKIIRSARREEREEELASPDIPVWPETRHSQRKKAKIQMRNDVNSHIPSDPTPEERNRIMRKGRVPVFDRINGATPKAAAPSKKKRPRI